MPRFFRGPCDRWRFLGIMGPEGYVPNKNQLLGGREFQKLLPVQEASPVMLAAMVGITRVITKSGAWGKKRQDEKIGNINGGLRIPGANGRVNEPVQIGKRRDVCICMSLQNDAKIGDSKSVWHRFFRL